MTNSETVAAFTTDARVSRATVHDAEGIHRLVNFWAARGEMLPRTLGETYENIRDFFVIREGGEVIACVALHITWRDLAEVKSLAVREDRQSGGHSRALVEACHAEGRQLGLASLFALTYRPRFFERLGWSQADVMQLPRKVWNECYRCPKFPGCEEIAMVLELPGDARVGPAGANTVAAGASGTGAPGGRDAGAST